MWAKETPTTIERGKKNDCEIAIPQSVLGLEVRAHRAVHKIRLAN